MDRLTKQISILLASSFSLFCILFILDKSHLIQEFMLHYLVIHSVIEYLTVFVSLSIALLGWLFYKYTDHVKYIIFSSAFVAVGFFDLFHLLTFKGMPIVLLDEYTVTTWFWIMARFTEVVAFSLLILPFSIKVVPSDLRSLSYMMSTVYTLLLSFIFFTQYEHLVPLLQNEQPTAFKNALEYSFALLHLIIFIIAIRYYKHDEQVDRKNIAFASFLLILSTLSLVTYQSLTDLNHFVAHVFKLLGYVYLLRIVFYQYGKKPLDKIEQLSNRYLKLLNTMGEGMYGIDIEGKVIFVNDSAKKLLGYREDELIGRSAHLSIHHSKVDGSFHPEEECPIRKATTSGEQIYITDDVFWSKEGKPVPVEYYVRPFLDEKGNLGSIITFNDISERKKLETLEQRHQAFQHEISVAARVQRSLLSTIPMLRIQNEVGIVSLPYHELNGDFHTIFPEDHNTTIAIADVCGKGIPAAIQMTMMKFAVEQGLPLHQTLAQINTFFNTHMDHSSFITMLIGKYDRDNMTFSYSSAGHEPAILYRPREQTFREISTDGPILGLLPHTVYEADKMTVEKGDIIVFYTDGIIERRKNTSDSNSIIKSSLSTIDLTVSAQEITEALYEK
ncbi:hypothetical protein Q73_15285 [Bacillus coahuilensis m2-6]|uniref:MASE3 domain-containing protein n=1 Tax=Bacillus coahuilensis TaxID=408580 RepID=UPI0007501AB1|nr:MASE3 domain-containing protein [Bacillus coahuilensis]KUP04492.1 hypothetical protein Q73_15285 [Bacillus coahuilensis m2-6]